MIRVHHRVLYASSKVDKGNFTKDWWDAWKFTIAVKSRKVNKFFHVHKGDLRIKVNSNNVGYARRYFGGWLLDTLTEYDDEFALVPVPSTDAVVGCESARHSEMLEDALDGKNHEHGICDVLRFTEELQKASHGGPRFVHEIYPKLATIGELPKRPIVLVDDVLTSGGHIKACRNKLEEAGCEIAFAVVCGRTVDDLEADPWAAGSDELLDACDLEDFEF